MIARCSWPKIDLELEYHDNEWGKVSTDNRYLFEMLVLEMMQAGLSWRTILEKREDYRELFHNFEVEKIVEMSDETVQLLYKNPRIIRNKLKINAIVHNAKLVVNNKIDLSKLMWSYTNNQQIINDVPVEKDIPSSSVLSERISKDLKKMGFKFIGPTIIYSYMHAIGMVDDHVNHCSFKNKI